VAPRIVAIDGPAGSGKSTLARGLARELGLPYVNTGLMYRALTLAALRVRVPIEDEAAVVGLADGLRFNLGGPAPGELKVEGLDEADLVSLDVETSVPVVARHPSVRRWMREEQRRIGRNEGAVMEGRDIGSVVFPDAPVKLYLEAHPQARASRRVGERATEEARVAEALHRRDAMDARTNPFEPSPDASVIDTSELTIEQTLERALAIVKAQAPELST
jgi:cytidylate kinase